MCPKSLQGRGWQGKGGWLLLFGVWMKLATFPTSKAMRQFQQTYIRNTFEMHLTLALTLNIQRFILLQHNVWILLLPGNGSGQ